MRKFNAEQMEQLAELQARYDAAREVLEDALSTYNGAVNDAYLVLSEAMETYTSTMDEIRDDVRALAEPIQDWVSDRSEKWSESERASEYDTWIGEIDGWEPPEASYEEPEALELPEDNRPDSVPTSLAAAG